MKQITLFTFVLQAFLAFHHVALGNVSTRTHPGTNLPNALTTLPKSQHFGTAPHTKIPDAIQPKLRDVPHSRLSHLYAPAVAANQDSHPVSSYFILQHKLERHIDRGKLYVDRIGDVKSDSESVSNEVIESVGINDRVNKMLKTKESIVSNALNSDSLGTVRKTRSSSVDRNDTSGNAGNHSADETSSLTSDVVKEILARPSTKDHEATLNSKGDEHETTDSGNNVHKHQASSSHSLSANGALELPDFLTVGKGELQFGQIPMYPNPQSSNSEADMTDDLGNRHDINEAGNGENPALDPDSHTGGPQAHATTADQPQSNFRPQSMLDMAVTSLQNPSFLKSRPGFGLPQGSGGDGTRSSSSTSSSDDWWSQDVWAGSKAGDDMSIWFQKSDEQGGQTANSNSDDSGTSNSNWWQQGSSEGSQVSSGSSSQQSSSASSSSSSSSTSSSSNPWGGSSGTSSGGGDSNLDSFSFSLWQAVTSNQGSPSTNSLSSGMFGLGSSTGFNTGDGSTNGGFSGNSFGMSQQGGMSSSMGQSQGGSSTTGFVQGGTSSGTDGMFSFGISNTGNGGNTAGTATGASSTGGGSTTSAGFDFGSSQQGFGSSGGGSSGDGAGSNTGTMNNNNNNFISGNSNAMTTNNNMFNFGGSSGMGGFSMAGGGGDSPLMGAGGGGSDMTMGMNPGFGGSQGNMGDNTAGMFFTFAQAQNSPGAGANAGFGQSQGAGSSIQDSSSVDGSSFPLQGAGTGNAGKSGLWGAQLGDDAGTVNPMLSQGGSMMSGGGGFQFSGGLSENNNAWQFSGMTNPGFSSPGFGGSQTLNGGGGGGTGFGSAQGSAGDMFSFSGTPGFGMSQGGQEGGGSYLNSFSMTGGMGGASTGSDVSMGVASGMTNTGMLNGGSVGGAVSNQGGSLSQVLMNFTRGLNGVANVMDEDEVSEGSTDNTESLFSPPQFLGNSVLSSPFKGGPAFGGNPSDSNLGSSGSSGNPFTGGSAPISGFTIGGGGQISAPSSGAKFNFGSAGSGNGGGANGADQSGGSAAGFPGTGTPFNQPQNSGGSFGVGGQGGGVGPSGSSPFSGAAGGGGNGQGASMASPFSAALSGQSPFSSSNGSPFNFGTGSSPFGSSSSASNPFNGNFNLSNPFLSGFQLGSSDSSGFSSTQLGQFVPQFNANFDNSQTTSGQQSGSLFQMFSFGSGATQQTTGDGSQFGDQFFGNAGSPAFSGFQTASSDSGFSFPMFQTNMGMRQAPQLNTMALSRFLTNLDSISLRGGGNGSVRNSSDKNATRKINPSAQASPSLDKSSASVLSFVPLSDLIDDAFISGVVKQYCADYLERIKRGRWRESARSIPVGDKDNSVNNKSDQRFNSKIAYKSITHADTQDRRSLFELCDSLHVGT